ncbi:unnamed protein product [Tetraodon nigroviridis]|uniref:(spotted green pufferfish) hypothetical protein n=1 Tax=Tetraodon nigroviridis TaxID=99883 RepID=Q4RJD8_TETNG|nr:unnamed protein product [Tetraodon nigroviridis]
MASSTERATVELAAVDEETWDRLKALDTLPPSGRSAHVTGEAQNSCRRFEEQQRGSPAVFRMCIGQSMTIPAYCPDAVSVFTLPRVRCAPVMVLVGSAAFVSLVTRIQWIRHTSDFPPFSPQSCKSLL